jgi:hypothetical protein
MNHFPPSPRAPKTTRRKILAASFEESSKNMFQGGSLNYIVEMAGTTRGGEAMDTKATKERRRGNLSPIVSLIEWQLARKELLVKEKAVTRERDALAAGRRFRPFYDLV